MRICLLQDIRLIPNECVAAQVQIDGDVNTNTQPLLAESDRVLVGKKGFQVLDAVLSPSEDGLAQVSFVNYLGITQNLEKGLEVSEAQPVEAISKLVSVVTDSSKSSKEKLISVVNTIGSREVMPKTMVAYSSVKIIEVLTLLPSPAKN